MLKVHWHCDDWALPGVKYVMFVVTDEFGNNHSHFHLVRDILELRTAVEVLSVFAAVVTAELVSEEPWTYEGAPSVSGWYAARWSWDAQEGVHCGACYWTGSAWAENFPVVAWHGPLQDSAAAYKYADDNDPDLLGGS